MNELEIRTEIQEEHASPLDTQPTPQEQKFCKHCGQRIAKDAVICVHCGRQVEELGTKGKEQPNIVITNTNTNTVHVAAGALKKEKNKWVALLLPYEILCKNYLWSTEKTA